MHRSIWVLLICTAPGRCRIEDHGNDDWDDITTAVATTNTTRRVRAEARLGTGGGPQPPGTLAGGGTGRGGGGAGGGAQAPAEGEEEQRARRRTPGRLLRAQRSFCVTVPLPCSKRGGLRARLSLRRDSGEMHAE